MNRQGQRYSPHPQRSFVILTMGRRVAAFLLASSILTLNLGSAALAQVLDTTARPVHGQISISREVAIAPTKEKVSLSLRDASVQDVLQMLAKQGKFNLMLDSGVAGSLTVDIKDVSINKALEYIFTMMDLSYVKDANTVMVAKKSTVEGKNMAVRSLKTIPVQYKSAVNIANQLNSTIFKVPRSSGSGTALAAADPDSNSLLVMGTESDIKLVGDALRELDVPRNRKVYHIRHNMPGDVAQVLAANFFRNNISIPINTAGGASATTAGSSGSSSSGGVSGASSGSASGGASSGGAASASASAGASSSGSVGGSNGVSVTSFTSDGVTFISEPVSATLTVLGTEEQIALIDSVIDQVDVQRAQVAIEVALVEIQNSDKKSYSPTWGSLNAGTGLIQLAPLNALAAGQNTFLIKNPFISNSGVTLPTSVKTSGVLINQSNRNVRSKVLANPTVVTIDGQAASINITDSVASITNSQTITSGIVTNTIIVTQQQAGVTVTLTPKIYNDGSVVMTNLSPTVTQPTGTIQAGANSVTLLSTRSMSLAGVRVRDGETLIVGGLLKEAHQIDVNKVPGLDKMPILGAMFRAVNLNNKDRTELVLMVTPHILKEDSVAYFKNAERGKSSNMNYGRGGIVPVALPKFMGPVDPAALATPSTPPNSNESPVPGPSSSQVPADDSTKAAVAPLTEAPNINSQLKSARIELLPTMPTLVKNESTEALKAAPSTPTNSDTTVVYRRPASSANPGFNPLHVLEEILK